MKESIHKYFKLGTLQWMSFPNSAPLDALTAIARDDFFDAVEIKSYGAEKEQAKAILDHSHLTVCFGAHPMQLKDKLNPNALDESERQKAEDALKGAIDEAAYLGATAMGLPRRSLGRGDEGAGVRAACKDHERALRLRGGKRARCGARGV